MSTELCSLLIMIILSCWHNGDANLCSTTEQSSLCFCRSINRRSTSGMDLYLAQVSLSDCQMDSIGMDDSDDHRRQCHQARFYPSTQHVSQLLPNLVNHTHCIEDVRCLQTLRTHQRCQQCQIITTTTLKYENTSHRISTTLFDLPRDSCFYLCEHDHSCGFLCYDRRVMMKIQCDLCRTGVPRRRNITCRCVREKTSSTICLPSIFNTTTPRWMQKRGFPAAGILAVLVFVTILLIILAKLISRRLDILARRKSNALRRSIATITTYRSRQPSPSTAISFPNTPLIPPMNLRKDLVTTNTMVELLNGKSQEYVVDIHRNDDEDELSVYLLEKTSPLHAEMDDIADIDGDDDEEEDERRVQENKNSS